jgi:hypothetical protein
MDSEIEGRERVLGLGFGLESSLVVVDEKTISLIQRDTTSLFLCVCLFVRQSSNINKRR